MLGRMRGSPWCSRPAPAWRRPELAGVGGAAGRRRAAAGGDDDPAADRGSGLTARAVSGIEASGRRAEELGRGRRATDGGLRAAAERARAGRTRSSASGGSGSTVGARGEGVEASGQWAEELGRRSRRRTADCERRGRKIRQPDGVGFVFRALGP